MNLVLGFCRAGIELLIVIMMCDFGDSPSQIRYERE